MDVTTFSAILWSSLIFADMKSVVQPYKSQKQREENFLSSLPTIGGGLSWIADTDEIPDWENDPGYSRHCMMNYVSSYLLRKTLKEDKNLVSTCEGTYQPKSDDNKNPKNPIKFISEKYQPVNGLQVSLVKCSCETAPKYLINDENSKITSFQLEFYLSKKSRETKYFHLKKIIKANNWNGYYYEITDYLEISKENAVKFMKT